MNAKKLCLGAMALLAFAVPGAVAQMQTKTIVSRTGSSTPVASRANLLSLSYGDITIASNQSAGGIVWSWKYKGVEFLNDGGTYGGSMQAAAFIDPMTDANSQFGGKAVINPTEAGASGFGPDGLTGSTLYSQGAQTLLCYNSGLTQISQSVPLDYIPVDFQGDFDTQAVEWSDLRMGKDVTLNWNGHPKIARYETIFYFPTQLLQQVYYQNPHSPHIVIPSIFVRRNFNQFWACHFTGPNVYPYACDLKWQLAMPPENTSYGADCPNGDRPALIVTDPTTGKSMGVYMPSRSVGGSTDSYSWWNFNHGTGTDWDSYAIMPGRSIKNDTPGNWQSYRVFIVCGDSVDEVAAEMAYLCYIDAK